MENILTRWINGYALFSNISKTMSHLILNYTWQYAGHLDINNAFKFDQIEFYFLDLIKKIKILKTKAIYKSASGLLSYDEALILNMILGQKKFNSYLSSLIKLDNLC